MTTLLQVIVLFSIGLFVTDGQNFEQSFHEVQPPNKYRFMSTIRYRNEKNETKHVCAGTLLTSQYIVSAAHCLSDILKDARIDSKEGIVLGKDLIDRYSVGVGGNYIHNPSVVVPVAKIIVHPGFYFSIKEPIPKDLMLLQLARPVYFNYNVFPICLPSISRNDVFSFGTVAGWYRLSNGSSNPVMTENVPRVWSQEECEDFYKPSGLKINNHVACVGGAGSDPTCQGDEGGPLFIQNGNKYFLLGMTSIGPTHCGTGLPTLFIKVPYFMPFLLSHTDYIGEECNGPFFPQ